MRAIVSWPDHRQDSKHLLPSTMISAGPRRDWRPRMVPPSSADPAAAAWPPYRANFLCLIRLGSSASGPSRRFLSSS